ncbi:MAG TPA: FAD-dependent thymidylate synthase [Actinomycetota bacterium]|nr:FAD-dependent thymidylate synthase [Actinomycetota bacterium]
MTHPYVVEDFTPDERATLDRVVGNTDSNVFVLMNLPEAVKGALFARYSRTAKSLRRLFLDEFLRDGDIESLGASAGSDLGMAKADELYGRIFIEFGDDSVAQLGGAHIAVEQASNILTKQLEWGRLAAYLEQSTRYVGYDDMPGGRWRYYLEPDIMASPHAAAYERTLDAIFERYAAALRRAIEHFAQRYPKHEGDPDRVWKATIKAKACDVLRGMLPAATVSNLGIYASGQAYEMMLMRMMASPLREARDTAAVMLTELNKVIPTFLQRVDQPDRGGTWIEYLRSTRQSMEQIAAEILGEDKPEERPLVTLTDFDPDAEVKLVAAMLYAFSSLPEDTLIDKARAMSTDERLRVMRTYVGERANRRHKPNRAFERVDYRFDVLGDYGGFRDLQRHRMLTIEWQDLTPLHGAELPPEADECGAGDVYRASLDDSGALWESIAPDLRPQAQYAVCMAYRIRYAMQMNLREAMHLIELRSSAQGHAGYRRVAHEMHRLIGEQAGHRAVAEFMSYVDYSSVDLERLEAERRAERKRLESLERDEP